MYNACQLALVSNRKLMEMISISIDQLGLADEILCRKLRVEGSDGPKTKKRMIKYDCEHAYQCILQDYLHQNAKFDDRQFERHFRITKGHFEFILQELAKDDPFWSSRRDCTHRWSVEEALSTTPHALRLRTTVSRSLGFSTGSIAFGLDMLLDLPVLTNWHIVSNRQQILIR